SDNTNDDSVHCANNDNPKRRPKRKKILVITYKKTRHEEDYNHQEFSSKTNLRRITKTPQRTHYELTKGTTEQQRKNLLNHTEEPTPKNLHRRKRQKKRRRKR
ncbi:12635_t:CDS:2, partial [Gigaspora rosea]